MTDSTRTCPKCQAHMVAGFIPDFTYGGVLLSRWFEGQAKKGFWRGVAASYAGGVPICAFRCSGCGYLESYASSEFAAQ